MPASISDIRMMLRVKALPKAANARRVFVTGGTGYLGSNLIPILIERGHRVRALVRTGSKGKLPAGCEVVNGDPLDATTYRRLVRPCDTFVHLVGVAHPSPSKAEDFRRVDLVAAQQAIMLASDFAIPHFVYVSVAHPAPIMRAYVRIREECEQLIEKQHLNATILRPWYVLGPDHNWPRLLTPVYGLLKRLPFSSASAQRLGLVTLEQMMLSLVDAIETPARGIRVVEVPEIRNARLNVTNEPVRQTA